MVDGSRALVQQVVRLFRGGLDPGATRFGTPAWNMMTALLELAPVLAKLPYDTRHRLAEGATRIGLRGHDETTSVAAGLRATWPEVGDATVDAIAAAVRRYRCRRTADLVTVATASVEEAERRTSLVGQGALEEALKEGRGALVVNVHTGPHWLVPYVLAHRGLPTSSVGFLGAWDYLLTRVDPATVPLLDLVEMIVVPDPAAPLRCAARLRRNRVVLTYGDITLPEREDERQEYRKGERVYRFDLSDTLRLARSAQAPVFVSHCRSLPGRHLLVTVDPVGVAPTADDLAQHVAELMIDRLEAVPEQASYWAYAVDRRRVELMRVF